MPTNLAFEDRAHRARASGHCAKKEVVTAALDEYVKHRERLRLLAQFGKVDYDPASYKAERRKKRA